MDDFPEEISWSISHLVDDVAEEVVRMPEFIYSANVNDLVEHTLPLYRDEPYIFSIYDMFGDGIPGGWFRVTLRLGEEEHTMIESDGDFGPAVSYYFLATLDGQSTQVTQPPIPDPTLPPIVNPPPPEDTINATLQIQMDDFPEEISWSISHLVEDVAEEVVRMPEGIYSANVNDLVEHTLPLHLGEQYTFSIFDSYGDGIYDGWFQVTLRLGEEEHTMIESDGDFGSMASYYFLATLDGNSTQVSR
jgi:hypothetical protein